MVKKVTKSQSLPMPKLDSSVTIRKIANGFIVSQSNYDSKVGYKVTEKFSAKNPIGNK